MHCWNGDTLFLSGHLPINLEGQLVTGRLGETLDVSAGYAAARLCALNLLASLKDELGDLDRVEQIVKVLGVVRCDPDFTEQHLVVKYFSGPISYTASASS